MHDLASLAADLHVLGVRPNQPLVVHSALRSIGEIRGGADTLISAFLITLGAQGSLLFPNLNIPYEFSAANPPRFDLQKDPLREKLGILPQVFKMSYAQNFSRHPTHSMMGFGPHCAELFAGHELAGYPCGPRTPWWRLAEVDGAILLLGVTQQANTSIHGPEEIYTPYQISPDFIDGVVVDRGIEINVRSRLHRWGNASDFSRINPYLEKAGGLRRGKIGEAEGMLVDARIFQEEVSYRLSSDPHFLIL